MMASKKGYRDVLNFSDDSIMSPHYYGLIAKGDHYYLAHYININEGSHHLSPLSSANAKEIQSHFHRTGWSLGFVEKWIMRVHQ